MQEARESSRPDAGWASSHIILGGWPEKVPCEEIEETTRQTMNQVPNDIKNRLQAPYFSRLGTLAGATFAVQKWMEEHWAGRQPAWCAVERGPKQGARKRRNKNAAATLWNPGTAGLEMDLAKGDIVKENTVVAKLKFGAGEWRKLGAGCRRADSLGAGAGGAPGMKKRQARPGGLLPRHRDRDWAEALMSRPGVICASKRLPSRPSAAFIQAEVYTFFFAKHGRPRSRTAIGVRRDLQVKVEDLTVSANYMSIDLREGNRQIMLASAYLEQEGSRFENEGLNNFQEHAPRTLRVGAKQLHLLV